MVHPGSGAIRLTRIIHEVSAAAAEMDIDSRFQMSYSQTICDTPWF